MANIDIDLSGLNIDQLADLVAEAQSEMASRERQRRKALRSELERRVAAEGYKLGDIIPELRSSDPNGTRRRKMPVKFRNPQNVPGEEVNTDEPILHHDLPVVRQVSPAYTLCSLDSRPADRDGIDEWYSIRTLECS